MPQEKISYEEIRSKKVEEYGTQFKDWIWILVKQYKDRTHFLFELLQNAEDAKATSVRLILEKDMLIIEHNGILFSKDDVVSITKVAKSTKGAGGAGSIGRFGIGFKSVYAYASTPKIYSGDYAFEIRDFIYPYEIHHIDLDHDWTRIEIPFNNGEIEPQKAFWEIHRALREQIRSDTLLFLNNISDLKILLNGSNDVIHISKEDRERKGTGGCVLDVSILYEKNRRQREEDYLLFTDCEEEAVCIAFKVDGKELVPVPNTSIFTFFPTDKESHQSFYIHAPFETTPARDNIVEDSERNKVFIGNICAGLQMAFCWMRDNGYLSLAGLNATYPIYQYPEDSIFYQIYENSIRIIAAGEKLIPTNKAGVFKSRSEILLPDNMSIVDNFDDDDIQRLFVSHKIFWIAKEISKDNCQQFREFLKKNFNFKTYTWKDVITRIDATFLKQKDIKWFERLFLAIRSFAVSRTENLGSHGIDVSHIPFIRLSDGSQVCAYDQGAPTVYINNPKIWPNKIENAFIHNSVIKTFYTVNLNVQEYNLVTIVLDDILPKYAERESIEVSAKDLKENISDLKIIKDAIQMSPDIKGSIRDYYVVTDGKQWFKPEELHIPSDFGKQKPEYRLLQGISTLRFITLNYKYDPKLDEKFFVDIGCPDTLQQKACTQNEYLDLVKKYIGGKEKEDIRQKIFKKTYQEGLRWNVLFEGFPEVMNQIDLKKSLGIAGFLSRFVNRFEIHGEIVGAMDQNFTGANVDSMQIYSALGILLSFVPWIYTKDGVKKSVSEIRRRDVNGLYEKNARRLMDILPFVEENQAIEAILAGIEDDTQKEMIKELLTDQESRDKFSKAWKNLKIKDLKNKDKKNKSPKEILEEAAKKKAKGAAPGQSDDPEAVTNPERRQKKLEDEFVKSMDFRNIVSKTSLRYTYQDRLSGEEKAFLKMQYNGYCQICKTTILKYDGEHHFQAINVMKTSELADQYKGALDTGWNSLCLCPNCAAKYQYGVKDISRFYDQVEEKVVEAGSEETIDIQISLQDKQETIHYTPKHFLALKTAMEVFSK